jgi:stage V sporulation protein S
MTTQRPLNDIEKAQMEENKLHLENENTKDEKDQGNEEEKKTEPEAEPKAEPEKESEKESEKEVKETPKELKVKADPPDVSADVRKRNVKKLAGAISHSLRANAEINVRTFGPASISKAAKALAIARKYIGTTNLKLDCSPAFITMKAGDNNLTGICFCTFASEKSADDKSCDRNVAEVKITLMVKGDPIDTPTEERKIKVKKLAGAITHALEEEHEVVVRCFGSATISKAAKAIAIARGYTATRGPDLYCWPDFITAQISGNDRTGILFYCYTNEL